MAITDPEIPFAVRKVATLTFGTSRFAVGTGDDATLTVKRSGRRKKQRERE